MPSVLAGTGEVCSDLGLENHHTKRSSRSLSFRRRAFVITGLPLQQGADCTWNNDRVWCEGRAAKTPLAKACDDLFAFAGDRVHPVGVARTAQATT